ncbi:MAG: hypothetical protein WC054_02785 [Candidatus Nanopelagicales bacterium]
MNCDCDDEQGRYATTVKQGADFSRAFNMPVTRAASARLQLRTTSEGDVVLAFTSPSNGLVISEAGARVTWSMTVEQTAALDAGSYVWDLYVTTVGGKSKPMIPDGHLTVKRAVTRDA